MSSHYFCSGCHQTLSSDQTTLSYEDGSAVRVHNSPDCQASVFSSQSSESSVISGLEKALLEQGSLLQEQVLLSHSSEEIIKFLSQTKLLTESILSLRNSTTFSLLSSALTSQVGYPMVAVGSDSLHELLISIDSLAASCKELSSSPRCSRCSGPLREHSGAAKTLQCLVCGNIQPTL